MLFAGFVMIEFQVIRHETAQENVDVLTVHTAKSGTHLPLLQSSQTT